jgi:hypothetical protein
MQDIISIDINTTTPSVKSQNIAAILLNNTLGIRIPILEDNTVEPTTIPDIVT